MRLPSVEVLVAAASAGAVASVTGRGVSPSALRLNAETRESRVAAGGTELAARPGR
jgi:acyl-coenzyme A synthetase/AMP-(fatty) acid ligase